jgi:uncharacterized membrane protein
MDGWVSAMIKTREDLEKGQILFIYAVAVVVCLMLVALVFDIGGAFVTYQKAATAVDAAAFAAAQQIDMDEFNSSNRVRIDQGRAVSAAGMVAAMNSSSLTGVVVTVLPDRVVVEGRMLYHSLFADAFGFGVIEATIRSAAVPGYGVSARDQ